MCLYIMAFQITLKNTMVLPWYISENMEISQ